MSNKKKNSTVIQKAKKTALAKKRKRSRDLKVGVWEQLLNAKIKDIEFPGGRTRKSYRLHLLDGRSVIATERKERSRVLMECEVLRKISKNSIAVPKLIATDGHFLLVQEDLNGIRLSQALHEANDERLEILLDSAITSLSVIQIAGSQADFDQQFEKIGYEPQWIRGLLDRPAVIGGHFKINPPRPELDQLFNLFSSINQRFVKWDARPGNAMVKEDGNIAWFDWEHCGVRNRLDDLAWLLCDEFVPDNAEVENRLIENNLSLFSDHFSHEQAKTYLYTFGVFHSCVRLGLILMNKKDGPWWDLDKCLAGDKAGITQGLAQRLCGRASRWSKQSEYTEMLSQWFLDIMEKLEEKPQLKVFNSEKKFTDSAMLNTIYPKQPDWVEKIFRKSKPLPKQGKFDVHGLKINIYAYDPETYLWVEKYLYPLNLLKPSVTQTTFNVKVLHVDDLVHSVFISIEKYEVDTDRVFNGRRYLDRILINEDITVDSDPAYGILWLTDRKNNVITLVLSVKVRWPLLELSRVVRDLITRYLEDQGWVLFHAGAVKTDNKNYLIIGDASAGKTSSIIALLSSGSAFISNERVFVKVENGKARMLSFPMPVAVGLGTMVQYPELIKFIRQPKFSQYPSRRMNINKILNTPERKWPELEDKIQFLPQEITRQFLNIEGVPEAMIDGLIVPNFKKNQPAQLESINKDTIHRVIKHNCIDRKRDEIYPPWMPLSFQLPATDYVNNIVAQLTDFPCRRFIFSADKNRRNEINSYPEKLEEMFEIANERKQQSG